MSSVIDLFGRLLHEPAWALAIGIGVVVLVAAMLARPASGGSVQRSMWRCAVVGVLILSAGEFTGITASASHAITQLLSSPKTTESTGAGAADRDEQAALRSPAHAEKSSHPIDALSPSDDDSAFRHPSAASPAPVPSEHHAAAPPTLPRPLASDNLVASGNPNDAPPRQSSAFGLLTIVWIAGTALLLIYLGGCRVLLWRFCRRAADVDVAAMIDRLHGLKQRLGMRRPVRLLESAELAGPVAFGILRPTVAIPQGLHQTFTRDEVDAMLAHELAHLAARDPLWQLIADATYSLAWWHPMLGWARRRLRMASEIAADEATQIVPRGPDALAAALVTLARTWTPQGRLAWLSLAERSFRSQLGRRVERLVKMSPEHPCSRRRSRPAGAAQAITLSLFLVLSAVGFTTWIRPQAALAKGETTMRVFHHSLRNSMAGVALAAVLATGGDASADPPPKEREAERRAGAERDHAEKSREEALRPRAEMAELHQHARRLKQAIGAAGEEKSDRTVELKRQLERISRRMAEIAHEHGHAHEHGPVPEQRLQAIARQLEELRGHHHRLIEAGRREEAAEVERKIGHLERVAQRRGPLRDGELKGPIRDGERKGPLPREGDEHVERRVAHLLEAAKRLETLGAHDLAGAVRKEAEMLQRHFREHPREGDAKRREHAEHGEHAEHAARLHHTLRQMNAEMQELRASLEEMRGQLRELQGGDRPNRRETDRIRPDRPRPDGIRPDRPRPDGARPDRPGLDRPRPDLPGSDRERPRGDRPDRPRDGDRDKGDRDKGDGDKGDQRDRD